MDKKIALVTGGSRGIGKACALELAKAGYDVAINYVGNEEAANQTVFELKKFGGNAEAFRFDVTNKEAVENGIKEIVGKYGRIDVLVNNAGITRDGLFMLMSADNWESVINTNLNSAYYVTKPIAKIMTKQQSGAIINMSSIIGIYGNAGQANYATAKAGLIGFTKALAKELAGRNIRVNAIAPGFIQTDMTKDLKLDGIYDHIPLKRLGQPEDIAKAVKFLAEDAQYVTGQVLQVDGGLVI
ncbi:MAG: 3-oxoacyl-[acyl-carrier-protein] reductase [Candidatus Gastranaerophilales bacterium]|nr:3-oxoacyl-[acyl-carrier-protein] reductase [Candidatus Gastranaerophilales bacterium]